MTGLLNFLKPPGMTSHQVVGFVRSQFGLSRVGHAGTLDPGAAGVLVLAVGSATRVLEHLQAGFKEYVGEAVFGCATDTQDSEGQVTATGDASTLTAEAVEAALTFFMGDIEQVPPMVSAVKVGGRKLYDYARRGQTVPRKPRRLRVERFELLAFREERPVRAQFRVRCSKGTYVRTLCHDLGGRLGVPAHLGFLVRTAVGPFTLAESLPAEAVLAAKSENRLPSLLLPTARAVAHLPRVSLGTHALEALQQGRAVKAKPPEGEGEVVCAFGPDGTLVALGEWRRERGVFQPRKVLARGAA